MLEGRPNKENSKKVDKRPSRTKESAIQVAFSSKESEPSEDLGMYGNAEFKRITRMLAESNIMADVDLSVLESACIFYDAHRQLEAEMRGNIGRRFKVTDAGNEVLSQGSIESVRLFEKYLKVVTQFGITPLSRMRITATGKQSDEMEDFESKYGS